MMNELHSLGVTLVEKEPTEINDELVKGVFGTFARVLSFETDRHLSGGKHEGNWVRLGYESWYQVAKVRTGPLSSCLVALKSIVSMGDMHEKALEEATRLALLGKDYAPEVYAVTPSSILKEFLVEDNDRLPLEIIAAQLVELNAQLDRYGLWIQGGAKSLLSHTVQYNGRLKLIDAGTGDISGTARFA